MGRPWSLGISTGSPGPSRRHRKPHDRATCRRHREVVVAGEPKAHCLGDRPVLREVLHPQATRLRTWGATASYPHQPRGPLHPRLLKTGITVRASPPSSSGTRTEWRPSGVTAVSSRGTAPGKRLDGTWRAAPRGPLHPRRDRQRGAGGEPGAQLFPAPVVHADLAPAAALAAADQHGSAPVLEIVLGERERLLDA
jgi:hypothetical protein